MKKILFDLWNGNLCPWKNAHEWQRERDEIISFIENQNDSLSEQLKKHEMQALIKLNDNYTELRSLEREAAFVNGFSLAVKLLFEALNDT